MFTSNQHEQTEENISFIKDGVQECYEGVRELLMNLHIRISNKDLPETAEPLLTRFGRQTDIPIDSRQQDDGQALNYDEHLQVVFILQESLPDIRKHVRVQHASVEIVSYDDFVMKVRDDGVGLNQEHLSDQPSDEHVGSGTMQERAQRISVELAITLQIGRGATVMLTLPQQMRTTS